MYTNNNNRNKANSNPHRNKSFVAPMQLDGYTARGEQYNVNDLLDILSTMKEYDISHMISIPVYSRKHLMYENAAKISKTANTPIGYILDFDMENATAKVSIFEPFCNFVDKFVDSIISFRVILDKNDRYLRQIIAIDITPASECDYSGAYAANCTPIDTEAAKED